MSGHSKWAGIKHKKAALDAKKGRIFTKITREIVVATRIGAAPDEHNIRLKKAIEYAKKANMPMDNIRKAIQRGNCEMREAAYEEVVYEGYGPAGVAFIVEAITDNKNRTASDIRKIFSSHMGNLGDIGCVSWMFNKMGYITVDKSLDEETVMNLALEVGIEDFKSEPESNVYEIITSQQNLEIVKNSLHEKNITVTSAETTMIPKTRIALSEENVRTVLKFIDKLNEYDDVKNVYTNFEISECVRNVCE
jgi:YebC/PmpR family DNA-binding regulatory protein